MSSTEESAAPVQESFKKIPATLILIGINVIVFILTYLKAGSVDGPGYTITLLQMGAQFNPLTLDKEWYRIFTHMFLHGGLMHLGFNMYALYVIGGEIEQMAGTKKFTVVYFVSGIASALNSLYWSMFTIGVGASGAIFGLFGFSLIINIFLSRRDGKSMRPLLLNFGVFIGINLLIAKSVNADNAAHFGGLAAGLIIGLYSMMTGGGPSFRKVRIEYLIMLILVIVYVGLPRYQVSYYKFFQQVLAAEDSTNQRVGGNLTDEQYLEVFTKNIHDWDTASQMLNAQTYLPPELARDTARLRKYIMYRKQENHFKKLMIERESYVYLDSIANVQQGMTATLELDYSLSFRMPTEKRNDEPVKGDTTARQIIKVLYDGNWVEIPSPPASFYRVGYRDSLGRWDGIVRDHYDNGEIQMKGSYKKNKRDGIFLYYSDHHTYTSAGRYQDDRSTGKWETYHENGELASEIFYNDGYFLKNLWDSVGNQLVIDGHGKETQRHPNGIIATEGEYRNGSKEGYWYGRHSDGQMHFEENFNAGRLLTGRSRSLAGETFVYDATSLFPLPEGGFEKFKRYVDDETSKIESKITGQVRISFRVTTKGLLTDVNVEKSLSQELDAKAKEIVMKGPRWIPAREHGHLAVDGFAYVVVDFD